MQIQTIGAVRTMTSRELAALAEKRHDNVMRVCRDLRDTGVCPQIEETPYIEQLGLTASSFAGSYKDSTGRLQRGKA